MPKNIKQQQRWRAGQVPKWAEDDDDVPMVLPPALPAKRRQPPPKRGTHTREEGRRGRVGA